MDLQDYSSAELASELSSRLNESDKKGYGCGCDVPDKRDLYFEPGSVMAGPVTGLIDLRKQFPFPKFDQLNLGSCTANGTLRAVTFDQAKQGLATYVPSRLYQYYNSRLLEHTTRSDSGATIRDAIKAYNINGACPESDWPYLINKFKTKPPVKSYKDGAAHRPVTYQRVWGDTTASKKVAMDSVLTLGYPIVIGFSVYESFESDATAGNGIVPMPAPGEQQIGGHCVVISGKDDNVGSKVNICGVGYPVYICDNSWGEGWGDHGSFYIPQDYLLDSDLAEDFWMIQTIK